MAHIGQKFGFRQAGFLRDILCDNQVLIACFQLISSFGDQCFEIMTIGVKFMVSFFYGAQHGIEAIDKKSDLIIRLFFHPQGIVPDLRRPFSYGSLNRVLVGTRRLQPR